MPMASAKITISKKNLSNFQKKFHLKLMKKLEKVEKKIGKGLKKPKNAYGMCKNENLKKNSETVERTLKS
jgi:hypothetical protein